MSAENKYRQVKKPRETSLEGIKSLDEKFLDKYLSFKAAQSRWDKSVPKTRGERALEFQEYQKKSHSPAPLSGISNRNFQEQDQNQKASDQNYEDSYIFDSFRDLTPNQTGRNSQMNEPNKGYVSTTDRVQAFTARPQETDNTLRESKFSVNHTPDKKQSETSKTTPFYSNPNREVIKENRSENKTTRRSRLERMKSKKGKEKENLETLLTKNANILKGYLSATPQEDDRKDFYKNFYQIKKENEKNLDLARSCRKSLEYVEVSPNQAKVNKSQERNSQPSTSQKRNSIGKDTSQSKAVKSGTKVSVEPFESVPANDKAQKQTAPKKKKKKAKKSRSNSKQYQQNTNIRNDDSFSGFNVQEPSYIQNEDNKLNTLDRGFITQNSLVEHFSHGENSYIEKDSFLEFAKRQNNPLDRDNSHLTDSLDKSNLHLQAFQDHHDDSFKWDTSRPRPFDFKLPTNESRSFAETENFESSRKDLTFTEYEDKERDPPKPVTKDLKLNLDKLQIIIPKDEFDSFPSKEIDIEFEMIAKAKLQKINSIVDKKPPVPQLPDLAQGNYLPEFHSPTVKSSRRKMTKNSSRKKQPVEFYDIDEDTSKMLSDNALTSSRIRIAQNEQESVDQSQVIIKEVLSSYREIVNAPEKSPKNAIQSNRSASQTKELPPLPSQRVVTSQKESVVQTPRTPTTTRSTTNNQIVVIENIEKPEDTAVVENVKSRSAVKGCKTARDIVKSSPQNIEKKQVLSERSVNQPNTNLLKSTPSPTNAEFLLRNHSFGNENNMENRKPATKSQIENILTFDKFTKEDALQIEKLSGKIIAQMEIVEEKLRSRDNFSLSSAKKTVQEKPKEPANSKWAQIRLVRKMENEAAVKIQRWIRKSLNLGHRVQQMRKRKIIEQVAQIQRIPEFEVSLNNKSNSKGFMAKYAECEDLYKNMKKGLAAVQEDDVFGLAVGFLTAYNCMKDSNNASKASL